MIDDIKTLLDEQPGLKAKDIAAKLDLQRREVNQTLHSNTNVFEKDQEAFTWSLRECDLEEGRVERPFGPFGPARTLIPEGQVLRTIDQTTSCRDALNEMLENDYSALPVVGADGRVLGVVTLESLLEYFKSLTTNIKLTKVLNGDVRAAYERAKFIAPDAYIDERVDWMAIQHVIVGTPEEPIGLLTIADIWLKLNTFSESFVLVHEIERGLRTLIEHVAHDNECTPDDYISEMTLQAGAPFPNTLSELSFAQYQGVMCSEFSGPHFEPYLGNPSQVFHDLFKQVNQIRNAVMHFRHEDIENSHREVLRTFRLMVRGALNL